MFNPDQANLSTRLNQQDEHKPPTYTDGNPVLLDAAVLHELRPLVNDFGATIN
jgi:hypothetical protein